MSNSEIRSRAWEIYKANAVVILGMTAVITSFSLVGDLTKNIPVRLLIAIAGIFINYGFIYFILRTWSEGKAQLDYITVVFRQPIYRNKIIPLVLREAGIALLACLPLLAIILMNMDDPFMLMMNWVVIMLALIFAAIVAISLALTQYIFILDPETKIFDIIKQSVRLMAKHWAGLLGFMLVIMIVPLVVIGLLTETIGRTTASILYIPFEAYFALARAGYVYERILAPAPQSNDVEDSVYEIPQQVSVPSESDEQPDR